MSTSVLSIRIKKELKEEVEKLGIDVKKVIENALENEVTKVKLNKFKNIIENALNSMDIDINEWIKVIKENRKER